jgi:glycosyltransferase involved in cell wall biosynthesis
LKSIAFTLIGGHAWVGGYNYQINLLKALVKYEKKRIQPYLFLGFDVDQKIHDRFKEVIGLEIIQSDIFNEKNKTVRLIKSIFPGRDNAALKLFLEHQIDVVFEAANFFGWRFPIPAIAWVPDMQHRQLRHLFNFFSYWKREIGFRFQLLNGRKIMLSSEDTQKDFEQYYPRSIGLTHVVRFAIPAVRSQFDSRAIADEYGLPEHFFFLPNQFWKHKNHECVVQALSILKSQGKDVVIAVSGKQQDSRDEMYFPQLNNAIKSLGLTNNFRLLGVIPYQHIAALMLSSSALLNPSKFEGWSTTVEEAKALGVKMILSDLKVHREQAGNLAVFFDPNSPYALAECLINFQPLASEEKLALQIHAIQYSEVRVSEYAKVFTDLVELASLKVKKFK